MSKYQNEMKNKKEEGINLITLTITVIIIAGITIATLTGNNGILTKAIEAKSKTEEAQEKEGIEIAIISVVNNENRYQNLNQINLQKEIDNQFRR